MVNAIIQTAVPILLLMVTGFLSRKAQILKPGDERVLSAYVYYFALPALFIIDLAETMFLTETLVFIFSGIIPIFLVIVIFFILRMIFKFSRDTFFLLILSTIFGSLAFFGIPFVTFAFPSEQTEHLATLSAATIGIVAIAVSITILEFYQRGESHKLEGLKHTFTRLAKNPLILSIVAGILLSVLRVEIPFVISTFLHMMGSTTSVVAIFMLGAFLYGKKYSNLSVAFGLSLLRIIFLPVVAFATLFLFNLPVINKSVIVLMYAMPVAVSLSILNSI